MACPTGKTKKKRFVSEGKMGDKKKSKRYVGEGKAADKKKKKKRKKKRFVSEGKAGDKSDPVQCWTKKKNNGGNYTTCKNKRTGKQLRRDSKGRFTGK